LVEESRKEVVSCLVQQQREGFVCSTSAVRPAADWWDAHVEAHKEPETINR
jgi:hypothetical protein